MATFIDPRYHPAHIDNMVLDPNQGPDGKLVDRLLSLSETLEISLVVASSVLREARHPNTPPRVRALFDQQIYTLPVERTAGEEAILSQLRTLFRGNALSGKHDADAEHVFEASKYAGYFITNDDRILRKRGEVQRLLGVTPAIVTIDEYLALYDSAEATYPHGG